MTQPRWPTAQDYVDRVRSQGCAVEIASLEFQGHPVLVVTFRATSGANAREIVVEMTDPLMSTTIARLDRRLGIKTYMFV